MEEQQSYLDYYYAPSLYARVAAAMDQERQSYTSYPYPPSPHAAASAAAAAAADNDTPYHLPHWDPAHLSALYAAMFQQRRAAIVQGLLQAHNNTHLDHRCYYAESLLCAALHNSRADFLSPWVQSEGETTERPKLTLAPGSFFSWGLSNESSETAFATLGFFSESEESDEKETEARAESGVEGEWVLVEPAAGEG